MEKTFSCGCDVNRKRFVYCPKHATDPRKDEVFARWMDTYGGIPSWPDFTKDLIETLEIA